MHVLKENNTYHKSIVWQKIRDTEPTIIFEPTCATARWALMHHFASVCLWLDKKHWTEITGEKLLDNKYWTIINGSFCTPDCKLAEFSPVQSVAKSLLCCPLFTLSHLKKQVGSRQHQVAFFILYPVLMRQWIELPSCSVVCKDNEWNALLSVAVLFYCLQRQWKEFTLLFYCLQRQWMEFPLLLYCFQRQWMECVTSSYTYIVLLFA